MLNSAETLWSQCTTDDAICDLFVDGKFVSYEELKKLNTERDLGNTVFMKEKLIRREMYKEDDEF